MKRIILTIIICLASIALGYCGYNLYTEVVSPNTTAIRVNRAVGILLMAAAVMLLVFHRWIVNKLMRFTTAILLVLALMLEPLLHSLGIPHPEGLWIPMLEGGAVLSALLSRWKQIKAKIDDWFRKIKGTKNKGS